MTTAESLRRFRERFHVKQYQIAESLGISPQLYSAYENNSKPSVDVIKKISVVYNVSADYLLGLSDNPQRVDNSAKETDSDRELIEIAISYHKILQAILDNYHKTLQAILSKHGLDTVEESSK